MGYYCTVPQCTSLAGKTKNVKFHRFPRDVTMADKWNVILKRGKPYTKYSKVCSLHFTQADYNVTTMGQWKTLSKDAVPSQNLPKLNPDGTVMVIRKSRTVKYKDGTIKREADGSHDKSIQDKWNSPIISTCYTSGSGMTDGHVIQETPLAFRLQNLSALASTLSPQNTNQVVPDMKREKQDANIQTDPLQSEEDDESQPNNSYTDTSDSSYVNDQPRQYDPASTSHFDKDAEQYSRDPEQDPHTYTEHQQYVKKDYEAPKDYTKNNEDYIPRTNEEYNKEAEKYALERKTRYEKPVENGFQKPIIPNNYQKMQEMYPNEYRGYQAKEQEYTGKSSQEYPPKSQDYASRGETFIGFQNGYQNPGDVIRNHQHNLQILQEHHRVTENQNFFNENHIKQEIDLSNEEEKYLYERSKEALQANEAYADEHRRLIQQQRLLDQLQHVKTEPETTNGADSAMQPQSSPYYPSGSHGSVPASYYEQFSRQPGADLLIAKQNALAVHTQLWQNSSKRPFFYSEPAYNGSQLLPHRYEDISKILQ